MFNENSCKYFDIYFDTFYESELKAIIGQGTHIFKYHASTMINRGFFASQFHTRKIFIVYTK